MVERVVHLGALGGLAMDFWEITVILIAFVGICRWYTDCQMRYWSSPEYRKSSQKELAKEIEDDKDA